MISKSDYEDLKMLENIHKGILSIYKKLFGLELLGKKDSFDYTSLVEELRKDRELEKNILDRIFCNLNSINAVLDKIRKEENDSSIKIEEYLVKFIGKEKDLLLARMLNTMHKIRNNFYSCIYAGTLEDYELDEDKIKGLAYSNKLMDMITFDQVRLMLSYLFENEDADLTVNIIWFKYAVAYCFPMIEDDFINNNFTVENEVYLTYPLIKKIFPEINLSKIDASIIYLSIFRFSLSILESLDNSIVTDKAAKLLAYIQQSNIKSCIAVLIYDEERQKLIGFIEESIEKLKKLPSKERIIELLEQVISTQRKSLERIRIMMY